MGLSRQLQLLVGSVVGCHSWDLLCASMAFFILRSFALQRCHRIGRRADKNRPRAIIVIISNFGDKMKVMSQGAKLKGTGLYIKDDFPAEWAAKRASLRPVLKVAKEHDESAALIQDKLRFKGTLYTTQTVQKIPLSLDTIGIKQSDKHLLFRGQYSSLSNLYPCTLELDGVTYNSAEQLYQYKKAIALGKNQVADKIIQSQTPYEAMKEGKTVDAPEEWVVSTGVEIMKDVAAIKYSQNTSFRSCLHANKGRCFVEVTRNKI